MLPSNLVKCGLGIGDSFEYAVKFFAWIIRAVSTVFKVSFRAASPFIAALAVKEPSSIRNAAVAIYLFNLDFGVQGFGPFFRDFSPFFIVVFLRRNVSSTKRTCQSATGNNGFHGTQFSLRALKMMEYRSRWTYATILFVASKHNPRKNIIWRLLIWCPRLLKT